MQEVSSFRDPTSQIQQDGNTITRMIYPAYFKEYNHLMQSGLYSELVAAGLMIPHKDGFANENVICIVPEKVEFISYPYEWCFSMLKDAALVTLAVNSAALRHGMMLKDASAFNVQCHKDRMTFIDTTSFMFYEPGMMWGAYRQFCQHFLYPLLCMKSLQANVWRGSIEGISAEDAVKLIPNRYRAIPAYWAHLYSQAMKSTITGQKQIKLPKIALMALLNHLEKFVKSLEYKNRSDWTNYDNAGSYTDKALYDKQKIVMRWLGKLHPAYLADLGANLGYFSSYASAASHRVIAIDSDHDCVNAMYGRNTFSPFVVNLCNPTPAIGWENTERKSFLDRLHVDIILALALIHHLCIGNNVPVSKVASMLSEHCKTLIIEFVASEDKQAVKLRGQKNIPEYTYQKFIEAFTRYFRIVEQTPVEDSKRTLFLMEKK